MRRQHIAVEKVAAVIPHYEAGYGFGSRILRMDGGELLDSRSPLTVMKYLLRPYGFSYTEYRHLHQEHWHTKQNLPIVWDGHVFITCKMTRALVPGDETYGFIRLETVDGIRKRDTAGSSFLLLDGRTLDTVLPARYVQDAMGEATLLTFLSVTKAQRQEQALRCALDEMGSKEESEEKPEQKPEQKPPETVRPPESAKPQEPKDSIRETAHNLMKEFKERLTHTTAPSSKSLTGEKDWWDLVLSRIDPVAAAAIRALLDLDKEK
ncbi:hypothetical protein [Sulfoacidibacillus thermotolerans]|uniref:Uncharacterized protein n=1 Tax=Sulfoacidibacillus thermotolerans TaxID=1765684 RepID=A0A2U3D648_SULT2|nr:hypothetical protein [Sulfoacidibacillus thermotolerans]PWI56753.1 hypothetical protein BM613_12055 [Sulfoacidibacillus thermotolerans]